MTRRPEIVAFAAALDGLSASPSDPDARQRYLDLVAPGEPPERRGEMATMSGCALVARGVWRALGVDHVLLRAPYRTGRAMADLMCIAFEAGAAHAGAERIPEPGDLVIVGGGEDGGGPEHVYTVIDVGGDGDAPPGDVLLESIDGGQRDAGGHQCIQRRARRITDGWDYAHGTDPGGGSGRRVRWVIDGEKVLEKFGA